MVGNTRSGACSEVRAVAGNAVTPSMLRVQMNPTQQLKSPFTWLLFFMQIFCTHVPYTLMLFAKMSGGEHAITGVGVQTAWLALP